MATDNIGPTKPTGVSLPAPVQEAKSKIIPLIKGAAKPIFDTAKSLPNELPFVRSASVKDDLAPIKARIQALWGNKDHITPDEMKKEIDQLKKGMGKIEKDLEELEFNAKFGMGDMLDARQKGSFAFEILSIAKNPANGG